MKTLITQFYRHCRLALLLPLLLTACSSLQPLEQPGVNITSFALSPDLTGMLPSFDIGIQITNPNRVSLPLRGISYTVDIEGNRILNGVSPDVPTVPAYSSADFVVSASPNLIGGARLLNNLMTNARDELNFVFRAKVDVGGLRRQINIEESGSFSLSGVTGI